MRPLRYAVLLAAVALGGPAFAQDPHAVPGEAHPAAEGSHGIEGVHAAEGGHAEAGEHHADYTGDHDHDGVANWRDTDSADYALGGVGQHLLNLLVLVGVLAYVARTPVRDALKNRAHGVRKEITEAARLRDEAKQRNDELEKRLASFEDEVKRMKAEAEAESRADEAKLVARAREEAARIAETAERNIRDEVSRARYALRKEAVDLAVKLAEQTLRSQVDPDDQRHLARAFLASLNRDEVNGNG